MNDKLNVALTSTSLVGASNPQVFDAKFLQSFQFLNFTLDGWLFLFALLSAVALAGYNLLKFIRSVKKGFNKSC